MASQMMEKLRTTHPCNVMTFVDSVRDDWSGSSSARTNQKPPPKTATAETQIQLILACDTNKHERHTLSIGSSTTLKTLFNDYARERGDSLRALRFSYRGNTLFLSSAGNKTPEQLNMRDQDVITVYGRRESQATDSGGNASHQKSAQALGTADKNNRNQLRTTRAKGKKKKQSKQKEHVKTLQDWKTQHSNKLSKLHDEAYPRLKEIRTKLNSLDLRRQLPKKKGQNRRKKTSKISVEELQMLPHFGIGGKAGKSSFHVQVGEVQNLYKTTHKPSSRTKRGWRGAVASLDLHGLTREEALRELDAHLPTWVDAAMRGSYPFVMPVTIVCGGGAQVLAGTVEQWIRERSHVANAIKTMSQ